MTGHSQRTVVGLNLKQNIQDVKEALAAVRDNEFGYLCTYIVHPKKLQSQLEERIGAAPTSSFTWSDLSLPSADWRRGVVGIISDLNEELNSGIQYRWEKATELINQQINYSLHINLPAIIIDLTKGGDDFVNLANIFNAKLNNGLKSTLAYWVKVPMSTEEWSDEGGHGEGGTHLKDPWNTWNNFRSLCEFNKDVVPVLELGDVPTEDEVDRWTGEPVKAIFISSDIFLTNAQGFPCLSKAHQRVIKKFLKLKAQVVIQVDSSVPSLNSYVKYIEYLHNSVKEEVSKVPNSVDAYAAGYEDLLQIPLQPLRDHLESGTYEVFEKDPVKYVLYEDAIYKAITDRSEPSTLTLMVVGAGRGPLVFRSLSAACRAKRTIHVYAVEKNGNAVNTLFHHQKELWGDRVTVVCVDMREFNPPVLADIIISELLGSLGDNELSPECLDGAQRFLKPDGVMIPKNYTSFVSPCMSIKYYQDIGSYSDHSKHKYSNFETSYIVHMANKYIIAPPQQLFTFSHPNYEIGHSNDRIQTLKFEATQDCILNGFSGYFESILYGDILMSIHPSTHSPGMFSWFPHFLPLREPVSLKKGDIIRAHFWRKSSRTGVWYEWTISSPRALGIHNGNGRSLTGVMHL